MRSDLRARIVAEARSWLGTPFRHQGRLKGVGCDCAGLVIGVARALGLSDVDVTAYGREPDERRVLRIMAEQLRPKAMAGMRPGDVLLLAAPRAACHMGIVAERLGHPSLIHAWGPVGKVVENHLEQDVDGASWWQRRRRCFAFPGLD